MNMSNLTGIFLDTGKLEEIRKYHALGVVRGVTTNPSILVKDGEKLTRSLQPGRPGISSGAKRI